MSQGQADVALVFHDVVAFGHLPQLHLRLLLFGDRPGFRCAAAANRGSGSSRDASIAHSAWRRARSREENGSAARAAAMRAASATGRPFTNRISSRTACLPVLPIGSSVQSHRDLLMQTGRTSTPCFSRRRRSAPPCRIPSAVRSRGPCRRRSDSGISHNSRRRRSAQGRRHGSPGNIGPEAFRLTKGPFGEFRRISVPDDPGSKLVLERPDIAGELERCHRPTSPAENPAQTTATFIADS